jgi:hypothetical protein
MEFEGVKVMGHAAPAVAATATRAAAIRACVAFIALSQMRTLGGLGFDA